MRTFGYIRVSSAEQNVDRQIDAMKKYGIDESNIFVDRQSGKDFDRPKWRGVLSRMRKGDLLCVTSLDRMGRNYGEIQEQWRKLTKEKQVDIVVFDMPLLDTRKNKDLLGTLIADIVLQILAYAAQHEREAIRQRQAEGIAAAKARGVKFGREARPLPENFEEILRLKNENFMTWENVSKILGMSQGTIRYHAEKKGLLLRKGTREHLFKKVMSMEQYRDKVQLLENEMLQRKEAWELTGDIQSHELYKHAKYVWANAKGYLRKLEKKEYRRKLKNREVA